MKVRAGTRGARFEETCSWDAEESVVSSLQNCSPETGGISKAFSSKVYLSILPMLVIKPRPFYMPGQ